VDFPGDTSQLVVIDKLPFPSPGDPLVQARSQRLMEQGRSPFTNYFLPKASIALHQGRDGRFAEKAIAAFWSWATQDLPTKATGAGFWRRDRPCAE